MHIDAFGAAVSTDEKIRPGTVFKCDLGDVSGTFLKAEVPDGPENIWLVHLDSKSGMPEFISPCHLHPDRCLVFPDATLVLREFRTPQTLSRYLVGSVLVYDGGVAIYAASHSNPTFDGHIVNLETGCRALVAPQEASFCPSWAIYPTRRDWGYDGLQPLVAYP
ncbi:hypothetical protein [Emcibacter sp. SYSU 3D8]|uniref:hypothetical protein n=1 Tax=Emcibacter sp. SYSU 3D8 TaxID=3133969 RepID=UPI0031FE533A